MSRSQSKNNFVITLLSLLILGLVLAIVLVPPNSIPRFPSTGVSSWPDPYAYWSIRPTKTSGFEMTDQRWAHLHNHEPAALSVGLTVSIRRSVVSESTFDLPSQHAASQLKIRYVAEGRDVNGAPLKAILSPWLDSPYKYTVQGDAPEIANWPSGIYSLTVEVQTKETSSSGVGIDPVRKDFAPYPMFLHLGGRAARTTWVPVLHQNDQELSQPQMDGAFVDGAALLPKGYPVNPNVTPWHTATTYTADLYQEMMQPVQDHFTGAQMIWEEPPGTVDAGLRFIRALAPKAGEFIDGLWNNSNEVKPTDFGFSGHRSFPVKDGPRGVGWTNGYVQGAVDGDGMLWMVNVSGQLRVMKPDGELITVVGWRVKPDKYPVWYLKPLTEIRKNMEFRGAFTNGGYPNDAIDPGWHQPMDVALDPNNPNRVYVAGFYENAVYQVDVNRTTWTGTVSVLAGDPNHASGLVNAVGTAARFHHPMSLVASLDGKYLYVVDHDNDAIRRIELSNKDVTTTFGGLTVSAKVQGKPGITCAPNGAAGRLTCEPTTTVRQAAKLEGVNPDMYYPYVVRIASTGELVVFDRGFNSLRRLNPDTKTAVLIDSVYQDSVGQSFTLNWAWLDVDHWGNAGLKDGIYWGTAVSIGPIPAQESSDRFNENYRYTSLDGSTKKWVFPESQGWRPIGQGQISMTRPPHYPWLMAVDPRGGVYLGGIGSHGLSRLRVRRADDPMVPAGDNSLVEQDWRRLWSAGSRAPFSYTIPLSTEITPANPLLLTYGHAAHNLLGLPDAWAVGPNATDAEIDALFKWPAAIANDAIALPLMRAYVRLNRIAGSTIIPPLPQPTSTPTPIASPTPTPTLNPTPTLSPSPTTTAIISAGIKATDNFNRADSGLLGTWTQQLPGADVVRVFNNKASNTSGVTELSTAFWNAITFSNDQYSKSKWYTGGGGYGGVAVRMSGTGASRSYYGLSTDSYNRWTIVKVINGIQTSLLSSTNAVNWVAGDTQEIRVVGSTISVYRNGALLGSAVDSALKTGNPGLYLFGNQADDWEGGNIDIIPTPAPCFPNTGGLEFMSQIPWFVIVPIGIFVVLLLLLYLRRKK